MKKSDQVVKADKWIDLMNGLAETVLEASDEEILEETRELGGDPLVEAEEVRKLLLQTLKTALAKTS